jgi:hypothetical protein
MTVTKVILISAATSVVLIGVLLAVGWGVAQQQLAGAHGGLMTAHHMRGRWFSGPGRADRGHARLCARLESDHVETHVDWAEGWLAGELELDDAQQAALAPVLDAASGWVVGLRDLCEAEPTTAPEALRLLSDLTARSDAATKNLVVAFDGFYDSLDESQRGTVDDWMRWPHHHGGH